MARLFDGSDQYLEIDSAVVTAAPLTMACWINTDVVGNTNCVGLWVGDLGESDQYWEIGVAGATVGDPARFIARDGTIRVANTTTGFSPDTWHHICGVAVASDDRAAFIDGGGKGTETSACTPANADRTAIGAARDSSPGGYMSGMIAEAGIWNVALTDAEVAVLALGVSPLLVRPANIVAYWPLIRTDRDRVGGYDMTAYNTPTWADHPPDVRSPWLKRHGIFVPAAAAAGNPWYAYAQQ